MVIYSFVGGGLEIAVIGKAVAIEAQTRILYDGLRSIGIGFTLQIASSAWLFIHLCCRCHRLLGIIFTSNSINCQEFASGAEAHPRRLSFSLTIVKGESRALLMGSICADTKHEPLRNVGRRRRPEGKRRNHFGSSTAICFYYLAASGKTESVADVSFRLPCTFLSFFLSLSLMFDCQMLVAYLLIRNLAIDDTELINNSCRLSQILLLLLL